MIYEPREDSTLLAHQVKRYAKGYVLDIGTGSGIQAVEAAKKKSVKSVLAVDIQKDVIEHCKSKIKNKKIRFVQSDLFSRIKQKRFNTVVFNPPFLPEDSRDPDVALDGGKHGYEVIERFLNDVSGYLAEDGIILIVFCSFTKQDKVDEIIKDNLLEFSDISKLHIFFEDLYVYKIEKSMMLKELEKRKITKIKKLAKGHRGLIYVGDLEGKKVTIKIKNPESKAIGRIGNEVKYLKLLNKHKIGPKVLFSSNEYFVYKFIEGDFIVDYIKNNNKEKIKTVLKDIFNQMYVLDKLKINKEEMHHPLKHVLVKDRAYLLDFERCRKTLKPHNVTQFCQFVLSINKLLKNKKISVNRNKLINLSKKYKKEQTKKNFNKIISIITK
jgi:HemK-related putative methylase